jgi:group I intron endonuclease
MKPLSKEIQEMQDFLNCEGVIYKITSPTDKIYIGQTVNLQSRLNAYKRADERLAKQRKIYTSIKKYGWASHTFEILYCCDGISLNEKERYYQEFFNSVEGGLNCRYTEVEDKSGHLSEETKKILSDKMKGRYDGENNPMYGKDWREGKTQEELDQHKINISNAQKGRFLGEKNPMYGKEGSMKGKFHTQEAIDKMKEAKKLYFLHNTSKLAKLVLSLSTGIYYNSSAEAAIAYGYVASTLRNKLNGRAKNNTDLIYC